MTLPLFSKHPNSPGNFIPIMSRSAHEAFQYIWFFIIIFFILPVLQYPIYSVTFNSLRPRQNGRHFPDDIFIFIFSNEIIWIFPKISMNFVPKIWINHICAYMNMEVHMLFTNWKDTLTWINAINWNHVTYIGVFGSHLFVNTAFLIVHDIVMMAVEYGEE